MVVILTSGTAAPEASTTVPPIDPVRIWAEMVGDTTTARKSTTMLENRSERKKHMTPDLLGLHANCFLAAKLFLVVYTPYVP